MSDSPQHQELNDQEHQWLADRIAALADLSVPIQPGALSEFFEQQRAMWRETAAGERLDANTLVNLIGAGVGQVLVEELGLKWVLATDEYGTELAVTGEPGQVLVFPMNAVAKRWSGESPGTIADLCHGVLDHVRSLRS